MRSLKSRRQRPVRWPILTLSLSLVCIPIWQLSPSHHLHLPTKTTINSTHSYTYKVNLHINANLYPYSLNSIACPHIYLPFISHPLYIHTPQRYQTLTHPSLKIRANVSRPSAGYRSYTYRQTLSVVPIPTLPVYSLIVYGTGAVYISIATLFHPLFLSLYHYLIIISLSLLSLLLLCILFTSLVFYFFYNVVFLNILKYYFVISAYRIRLMLIYVLHTNFVFSFCREGK